MRVKLKLIKRGFILFLCTCLVAPVAYSTPQQSDIVSVVGNQIEVSSFQPDQQILAEIRRTFVDRPELLNSFVDALMDGSNPKKIEALANQFENNEETFQRLFELILEKHGDDPTITEALGKSALQVERHLRFNRPSSVSWFSRMFEFSLFTITYLGMIYSLHGLDPDMAKASFDSAFGQNLGLTTIFIVILSRQAMSFRQALSEYSKSLKDRVRSRKFLNNFAKWMSSVPNPDQLKVLSLTSQVHQYAMSSQVQQKFSAELLTQYRKELQKLNEQGHLKKFLTFFSRRKMQKKLHQMVEYLSPYELKEFLENPDNRSQVMAIKPKFKIYFVYQSIKQDVENWLAQQGTDNLSGLRSGVQIAIQERRDQLARRTRLSILEMINVQILTVGTIAFGLGMSISATAATPFDFLFSPDHLSFLRSQVGKNLLGVAMLVLPAVALALHEFSWIIDLAKKRKFGDNATIIKNDIQNLENLLEIFSVLELDPEGLNPVTIDESSSSEKRTAFELIERMMMRVDFSQTPTCEQLLETTNSSGK